MHLALDQKVALITGAARGIGRATALKLAGAGCDIAIVYYNSSDKAETLKEEIQALGRKAITIQGNVADQGSVREIFSAFKDSFSELNFLISNAASGVLKPALKMTVKHWRWCMETNALALNHLAVEGAALMPKGGRILALSSLGSQRALPDYSFIGASKAALEALVRYLSLELAPAGITVNTVSAGVVDTDALKAFPARAQLLDAHQTRSLSERSLTPQDVADVIYLLLLPEAQMIKGQVITVDAGYSSVG